MANILSLAVRVTGDASGLQLNPVEKALQRLQQESDKTSAIFEKFAQTSELGAKAQEAFDAASSALLETLKAGTITRDEFVRQFNELGEAARRQAAALEEGARVTASTLTVEEKRAKELQRLDGLLQANAISEETYNRAVAEASGANAEAARQRAEQDKIAAEAIRERQSLESRAASIIAANLTIQERYDRELADLNNLQREGLLTQEQYNRAVAAARKPLDDAAAAAQRASQAAGNNTLRFNELSGVFSALPGPLGNIAGRLSGLSSAGEGLSRIFSGGLTQGFSGIASSVTSLINPMTLAVGGIAAFGAAAAAVTQGLIALEDRVERLGNLARQLGVSFEFVQVLEEAGQRTGVSLDSVAGAMTRLQKTLAGADEESKSATKALERLGIQLGDLEGLSEQAKIELIGQQIGAIEDPAKRTAAAVALFGRSGTSLLPFFENLAGAANDIERYGRALTQLDQQRVDEFGASLDALGVATRGLGDALILPFAGLGDGIARSLAEITSGFTAIIDPIGKVLEPVFTQLGRIIELVGRNLGNLGKIIGSVFEPFATIVQEVSVALEPLYEGVFEFLGSIGDAAASTAEWVMSFTPVGAIADNISAVTDVISRVVTIITTLASRIGEAFQSVVSYFADLTQRSELLSLIGSAISKVFSTITEFVGGIVSGIGTFVDNLLTLAENFLGIERSASGAAEATDAFAGEVAALTKEEKKQAEEREKFLAKFSSDVSKAIDESAQFGQAGFDAALQYQNAIADLQDQLDRGILNETSFQQAAERATAAYQSQIDAVKKAAKETQAITDQVDTLLEKANEVPQLQQDITAVEAEIARVEAAAAKARAEGNAAQADSLTARLAQLDQLQAGLLDQQDQAAQGFEKGYAAAFEKVDEGLSKLSENAAQFGEAGFEAAQKLSDGIAAAKRQAEDGILNREAFEAEVARQEELYSQRIQQLEKEKAAREEASKASFQREVDANSRVQQFLFEQFGKQDELAQQAFQRRGQAAENILAIEKQLQLEQQSLNAAREQGDSAASKAAVQRINALKGALDIENQILNGKEQQRAVVQQQAVEYERQLKAQQQQIAQAQAAQRKQTQEFQSFLDSNTQENARALERNRELATASSQTAQGADIRTAEGAKAFIAALQGGFDPQYAVALQQLKVQQRIATGIDLNLRALGFQTFSFPAAAGG